MKPEKEVINDYINDLTNKLLVKDSIKFWVLGRMLNEIDLTSLPKQIVPFKSIKDLVKKF